MYTEAEMQEMYRRGWKAGKQAAERELYGKADPFVRLLENLEYAAEVMDLTPRQLLRELSRTVRELDTGRPAPEGYDDDEDPKHRLSPWQTATSPVRRDP